jgi:hypothetical protein
MSKSFRINSRRNWVFEKFVQDLSFRDQVGNTAFRQHIIQATRNQFGVGVAAAATLYNAAKGLAVAQGVCEEFGRTKAAGSKRSKKAEVRLVDVVRSKDRNVVASSVTMEEATAIVEKAIRQKKAKLEIA